MVHQSFSMVRLEGEATFATDQRLITRPSVVQSDNVTY